MLGKSKSYKRSGSGGDNAFSGNRVDASTKDCMVGKSQLGNEEGDESKEK